MTKKLTIATMLVMTCCGVLPAESLGRARESRNGSVKRLEQTTASRTKPKVSTNKVVIADGVWKDNPGGLFGKSFGEKIKDGAILLTDKKRKERYMSFQPTKRFRKFGAYRRLVDPRTRLVYGLTCTARFETMDEARKELDVVKAAFKQKFPNASPSGWIGYEEGGGGWMNDHWSVIYDIIAPEKARQIGAAYELVIRAVDEHYRPPSQPPESPSVAGVDAL